MRVTGRLAKLTGNTAGASAVEFALIAPILFFLMMGIIAYGIYFSTEHAIQQITADAARTALAGITDEERTTLVKDYADKYAEKYAFIERDKLVINVAVPDAASTEMVVTVQYNASELPIWSLMTTLPMPSQTIVKQSSIRLGGI